MRVCDDHESNLNLIPSPEVVETLIKKIYDYDKTHNYIKDDNPVKIAKYYLPPALNNPCTMVQNSLHIKFNDNGFGEAISCSGQDIVHGNIKNNNIKEILEVKKKATIFSKQDMLIQGPCSKCEFYDLLNCHGGCRGNANNSYACPRASDPQCLFIRKEIRDDIKIMAPSNCSECEIEVCARKTNISKTR
jgi:MoaA/NifB/PqqE/SkfB family radical SAM enzyme